MYFNLCWCSFPGPEQAEWDPGSSQGDRHQIRGGAGGLHGGDRHPGLLRPPLHR